MNFFFVNLFEKVRSGWKSGLDVIIGIFGRFGENIFFFEICLFNDEKCLSFLLVVCVGVFYGLLILNVIVIVCFYVNRMCVL